MNRAGLDRLITDIHRNFTAASCTVKTFRDHELDDMETDGLKRDEAAQVYDEREKKLNFLIKKLGEFSQHTPNELEEAAVVLILKVLIYRIKVVLEITNATPAGKKAWENTTLRSTTLHLAARNSFTSILEFIKTNKLFDMLDQGHKEILVKIMVVEDNRRLGIGTYAKTSGLGSFISPAIPKPQTVKATSPEPPKIAQKRS
jgi:hypothetical protein